MCAQQCDKDVRLCVYRRRGRRRGMRRGQTHASCDRRRRGGFQEGRRRRVLRVDGGCRRRRRRRRRQCTGDVRPLLLYTDNGRCEASVWEGAARGFRAHNKARQGRDVWWQAAVACAGRPCPKLLAGLAETTRRLVQTASTSGLSQNGARCYITAAYKSAIPRATIRCTAWQDTAVIAIAALLSAPRKRLKRLPFVYDLRILSLCAPVGHAIPCPCRLASPEPKPAPSLCYIRHLIPSAAIVSLPP